MSQVGIKKIGFLSLGRNGYLPGKAQKRGGSEAKISNLTFLGYTCDNTQKKLIFFVFFFKSHTGDLRKTQKKKFTKKFSYSRDPSLGGSGAGVGVQPNM